MEMEDWEVKEKAELKYDELFWNCEQVKHLYKDQYKIILDKN